MTQITLFIRGRVAKELSNHLLRVRDMQPSDVGLQPIGATKEGGTMFMSEPKEPLVGTDEADVEVELTTQDLRELSETPIETPTPLPSKATGTAFVSNARALHMKAGAAPARHVPVWRFSLALTLAIGAIGALYLVTAPSDEVGQAMTQNIPVQVPQPDRSEPQSNVEGEPVRFVNPFDRHEVFEFPAGTTEAEARDAVAQLLLERAMKRQRKVDALVSKNY